MKILLSMLFSLPHANSTKTIRFFICFSVTSSASKMEDVRGTSYTSNFSLKYHFKWTTDSNDICFGFVSNRKKSSNLYCYPCAKIFYKWLKSIDYIQQYLRWLEAIYITESVSSFLLRRVLRRHIFWKLLKLQK